MSSPRGHQPSCGTWKTGQWQTDSQIATWAEGIATRVPAEMTMQIMRALVDDIVLVDEDELRQAVKLILEHTHNLAEGAGAASVAAARQIRERLRGKTVVGILSGGNLDLAQLPRILAMSRVEKSVAETGQLSNLFGLCGTGSASVVTLSWGF